MVPSIIPFNSINNSAVCSAIDLDITSGICEYRPGIEDMFHHDSSVKERIVIGSNYQIFTRTDYSRFTFVYFMYINLGAVVDEESDSGDFDMD
jgi:hypothetical protein